MILSSFQEDRTRASTLLAAAGFVRLRKSTASVVHAWIYLPASRLHSRPHSLGSLPSGCVHILHTREYSVVVVNVNVIS